MGRPPSDPADLPVRIIRPEIRLYASDADIRAYLDRFPDRSQPAAIKIAIRAALTGGTLGIASPPPVTDQDDSDLDDFIG